MEAAAHFHCDPDVYFSKDRLTRAAMTGFVIGKRAIEAMQAYDNRKKPKGKS